MAIGDKTPVVMGYDLVAPGGVATLDSDGILSEVQRPDADGIGAIPVAEKGSPGGVATLDSDGVLSEAQRPDADGIGAIPAAEKGSPGGVATLDENGELDGAQRPDYSIGQVTGLQAALDAKQGALTFDAKPAQGSRNPVTSGGVYDALSQKQPILTGATGQLIGIGDDGTAQATVYPSNKNLLANWYFVDPINRQGLSEYTAAGGGDRYTIDRYVSDSTISVHILDDRIKLVNERSTAGAWWIRQFLEKERLQSLVGKTMTVSALLRSSTSINNFYAKFGSSIITNSIPVTEDFTLMTRTFTLTEVEGDLFIGFVSHSGLKGNETLELVAAKLELGPVQTLAHKEGGKWVLNEIPSFAEQYAICSQYSPATGEFVGSRHSSPNLLDNWYFVGGGSQQGGGQFPINQRIETEHGGPGYAIDRWQIFHGVPTNKMTAALQSNGILLNTSLITAYWSAFITQLEKSRIGEDDTITFSVLYRDCSAGNVMYLRINNDPTTLIASTVTAEPGDGILSITLPTSGITANTFNCGIYFSGVGNATIVAAKLELGPVQTLAHKEGDAWVLNDPPPNYALELAKCQRYYERDFVDRGYGVADTSSGVPVFIPFRVDKRIPPHASISFDKSKFSKALYDLNRDAVSYIDATAAINASANNGGCTIFFTAPVVPGHQYVLKSDCVIVDTDL